MSYKRSALVATLSLLAACGGDSVTSPIDAALSGTVAFNFTGGGGGSFGATGAITSAALASSPFTTTWAAGYKDATDKTTNIAANVPKSATTSDFVAITFNGQTASTGNISPSCIDSSTTTCNAVGLLLGHSSSGSTFTSFCALMSGSITLSSISSTNATGSFSGSGTCVTATGTSSAWVVTNGTFNVPLLPNVPSNLP